MASHPDRDPTTSDERRLRNASRRIGIRRALRIVAGLRGGYAAMGVLSALAWALVGVPREELPGAGTGRHSLAWLLEGSFRSELSPVAHAVWLAARSAVVATLAAAVVEIARRPLAWGLAAVVFQVVAIAVDLATGVSQSGQIILLMLLLGLLPGCAIVATQTRRDRAAWIATLLSIRKRRRAAAGVPPAFAVRTPHALASVLRAARIFYVVGAVLAGFVACAYLGIGRVMSPTHYLLDVSVLWTLCMLLALGAYRLWQDPAGYSMTVAIGTAVLAAIRLGSSGIANLNVVWTTLYLLAPLGALAATLRGAAFVMDRYPDHRFVRRLGGEHWAPEPSRLRGHLDPRQIEATRRAFQRKAALFALGAVVVFGTMIGFLRLASPPPLVPAVERYVADWNSISERVLAGTHDGVGEAFREDPNPWDTDPYYVPNELEGRAIEIPDPFVAEATQGPAAAIIVLKRNARHSVNLDVRLPVIGLAPKALVVRFRLRKDTDSWEPVRNSTGKLRD